MRLNTFNIKTKSTLPDTVDVLIAGSGPAGLSAANNLKKSGASILLVDARPVIGYPLRCGEITRSDFFSVIGIEPKSNWVRWRFSNGAIVLNRPEFENEFANQLKHTGIIVCSNTSVIGVGPYVNSGRIVTLLHGGQRKKIFFRFVIAADGISSSVACMAGFPTFLKLDRVATCLAYRVDDIKLKDPGKYIFHFKKELAPFYFWIIPNGEAEANIGLGILGNQGFKIEPLLEKYMRHSQDFSGGKIIETIVANLPSTLPMRSPFTDGLLIAGAAARFVDASMGEGIYQAAVSGKTAAEVILSMGDLEPSAHNLSKYRPMLSSLYQELYQKWEERVNREHTE